MLFGVSQIASPHSPSRCARSPSPGRRRLFGRRPRPALMVLSLSPLPGFGFTLPGGFGVHQSFSGLLLVVRPRPFAPPCLRLLRPLVLPAGVGLVLAIPDDGLLPSPTFLPVAGLSRIASIDPAHITSARICYCIPQRPCSGCSRLGLTLPLPRFRPPTAFWSIVPSLLGRSLSPRVARLASACEGRLRTGEYPAPLSFRPLSLPPAQSGLDPPRPTGGSPAPFALGGSSLASPIPLW